MTSSGRSVRRSSGALAPAAALPRQALHALAALVHGFTIADERCAGALLRDVLDDDDDDVAAGLRGVVLRVVFLLCAGSRDVAALFERLGRDAARAPGRLRKGHGAWARLLVLFRRLHDDPRTRSDLFDPDRWPFLEGRPRGAHRAPKAPHALPRVPDDVVLRMLELLLVVDGQRVDPRALDVEVLGAIYEHLRGFRVRRTTETSLALGPRHVVVGLESLLALDADARARWLKDHVRVTLAGRARDALAAARTVDDVVAALARRASTLVPRPVARGGLLLAPSDARRRAGMHYTPRALTEAVVRATLDPLVDALGKHPRPEQILALSVCDPAMGAGAFVVEACRQLAAHVVAAEAALGRADVSTADALRRVARRCLHGVDVDDVAVALARMSLWLVAGTPDEPWTFVDDQLRCGDALVGFSRAQIERFDWRAAPPSPPTTPTTTPTTTAHDDEPTRALLRRRGDALAAAFLAHDGARARETARARQAAAAVPEAAATDARCPRAFHWELEFPTVFRGEAPGFCAVVGNPPFLNAIEAHTGRNAAHKALYAQLYPTFARGAYDLSVLFLARTTTTLLRRDGRYGLLVPLALLSSDRPWRHFLHERWRPDTLFAWPVDRFDDASVRIAGLVGGAGQAAACSVVVDDGDAVARHVHRFGDDDINWYAALTPPAAKGDAGTNDDGTNDDGTNDDGADDANPAVAPVALSSRFVVHAGCATAVAYALRPHVHDGETSTAPEALKLVTTGALDRYRLRWGDCVVRFLKRDHRWPRWPAGDGPPVPRDVARARDAQRRPKLLVGGLSAVLEAWFDDDGSAGGVVSTWVIVPRAAVAGDVTGDVTGDDVRVDDVRVDDATALKALSVCVNAASSSRAFLRVHGAAAMSGHQTTIKKAALSSATIPDVFACRRGFRPDALAGALHDVDASTPHPAPPPRFVAQLALLHDRLASSSSSSSFGVVDAFAHIVVARLLGRTRRQAVDDLRWWKQRTRRRDADDTGVDVDVLARRVYALPVVDA